MERIALDKLASEALRLILGEAGTGWIVASLLWLACLHLYRETKRAHEARIGETGAVATALERASQTNAAVAAALESRTRALEDLSRLTSEIAREVDRNDERTRDKFDELLRRVGEIRRSDA